MRANDASDIPPGCGRGMCTKYCLSTVVCTGGENAQRMRVWSCSGSTCEVSLQARRGLTWKDRYTRSSDNRGVPRPPLGYRSVDSNGVRSCLRCTPQRTGVLLVAADCSRTREGGSHSPSMRGELQVGNCTRRIPRPCFVLRLWGMGVCVRTPVVHVIFGGTACCVTVVCRWRTPGLL